MNSIVSSLRLRCLHNCYMENVATQYCSLLYTYCDLYNIYDPYPYLNSKRENILSSVKFGTLPER